jgi:hypothetical protein
MQNAAPNSPTQCFSPLDRGEPDNVYLWVTHPHSPPIFEANYFMEKELGGGGSP